MKSIVSRFLVISILSISFLNASLLTSFASSSSDVKETASKSDANFDINDTDTYFDSLDDYQPFADTLPSVNNTVASQNIYISIDYYDMNGGVHSITQRPSSSNGYFSFPTRPKDFASLIRVEFYLVKSSAPHITALPSPGNYDFSVRFSSNTGGINWKSLALWHQYSNSNAQSLSKSEYLTFQQLSTDFYFKTSLKVASNGYQSFSFWVNSTDSSFSFPFGGYISVNFTQISNPDTQFDTSLVPPPSSTDIQQNISDSVGNISSGVTDINNSINSGVSSINGNLEEIIRTISMQLEAFWNQLYNLVHLDDNKNRDENTKKITDKLDQTNKNLDTIDTDILDGFDSLEKNNDSNSNSIINNNNQNTSSIINNNNENTDKLANGYDNSSMIENNDKLAGKLDEYEKLENELLSDTKDNLNNFQFENPFLSFNAVMSDISYILTSIYNGLGSFNIPIAFSMTLTIAMLCIGWYRFKAGG